MSSLILLFAAVFAFPQADPPSSKTGEEPQKSVTEMGQPDVTLVIREHSTTADMVEVTMQRADYPLELLREQIERLGVELNAPPRGLDVRVVKMAPNNKNLQFVKATFAINGILDKAAKRLDIQPVLRAFAGAPEPYTIDAFLIIFDGERPGPRTVKSHKSDAVEAEAEFVSAPTEIEYHVRLKTQDPSKIDFPAQAPEPSPPAKPSEEDSSTPVLFYAALGAGALAVGALVYLALLRGGGSGRR